MKYSVFEWRPDKKYTTYQRTRSVEKAQLEPMKMDWFCNEKNYGKYFLLYYPWMGRMYMMEYTKYMGKDWISNHLSGDRLFLELPKKKEKLKKLRGSEAGPNQNNLF